MSSTALGEFVQANRQELLDRCGAKVINRSGPPPEGLEVAFGIPQFMDYLVSELDGSATTRELKAAATRRGRDLFNHGFTVEQVVHDYGDLCQSITDLAVETAAPISPGDFGTLNRCLDDAIASAVTEYATQERVGTARENIHLRNLVYTALTAFEALQPGKIGVAGATGDLVHRSLRALRAFVDSRPA